MQSEPNNIEQILLDRLKTIGIEPNLIPGFIKDLANSFFLKPDMNLMQVNERLNYLGWEGIELDYHTYQLAKECLERNKS